MKFCNECMDVLLQMQLISNTDRETTSKFHSIWSS